MTPAINAAKLAGVQYNTHQYDHDPTHHSYGLEAAEKMGVVPERVFKTLVVSLDNARLAVAVLPVVGQLNLKKMAKASGAKKAVMADKLLVQRATGYVLGGVSPLGQKKPLPTVIDTSAEAYSTVFVSAGRRGLEIELAPQDLQQLLNATIASLAAY